MRKSSSSRAKSSLHPSRLRAAFKSRMSVANWAFPTYYVWKSKYGGMEAADLQRPGDVETEYGKLERKYAELAMENPALKDVIAKGSKPCA